MGPNVSVMNESMNKMTYEMNHLIQYTDSAKPKSGAPGLFILTGCRISENKRLWNCPPFGFPGYYLIMSFSSLPNLLNSTVNFT